MMRLPSFRFLMTVPVCLTALALAPAALADVPPQNECSSLETVGSACTTAGPSFDQDGVCKNETCSSPSPPPNGTQYACVLCELTDAGTPNADSGPTCPTGHPNCNATDAGTPGNACAVETLGGSCTNAGPKFNERGVCAIGTCANGSSCSLCQLADGGTTSKDGGAKTSSPSGSSSGCAAAPVGTGPLGGASLFGLGAVALALAVARRRRNG